MIVLDTHIWLWWVSDSPKLTDPLRALIDSYRPSGFGISIFSCWEVAKLVEKNRLELSCPVDEWINTAIAYPEVQLLDLTIPIVIRATQLEGFHNDPADQIIVATAQIHRSSLLTIDRKIANYPHIQVYPTT